MVADDEYQAFLHIVHVSDMHCRFAASVPDMRTERLVQWTAERLRPFSAATAEFIEEYWAEGIAGHDPRAPRRFFEFLSSFASDPEFRGIETWLVDTGDLSSMGDTRSIVRAKGWLDQYRKVLKAKHTLSLYGNHDGWPERFPSSVLPSELEKHRSQLRKRIFPEKWPLSPLETTIPGTGSKVQFFSINSIIHDQFWNVFARGHVADDWHWESQEMRKDQLAHVAIQAEKGGLRNFRILAVHHPIHHPGRSKLFMSMLNDTKVANSLISFATKGFGSLPHLVVSGHTHFAFPGLGKLEASIRPPSSPQKPLTVGQLQLVIGSLAQSPSDSQRNRTPVAEFIPHQCEILTFWASPKEDTSLLLERRIVGRPGGTGPYRYISYDDDEAHAVESVLLEY